MELRQLEYLVAVAEEANFTRAAERVHISQSGISAQIRQLENDLGATLIDRSTRAAMLTPAGSAALDHARATLASAAAVRQAVEEVSGLLRGRLVIGMVTACTVTGLFDALAAFRLAHPGVEIVLFEDSSDRLIECVRSGVADVALVGASGSTSLGRESLPILSERLVAAVPAGHPLARRRRTTLAALGAHPLICLPVGTGVRAVFDDGCGSAGVRPNVALQASAPATIADLAIRGLGVAILSETMAAGYPGQLESLLIDDIKTHAMLALVWTSTESPALDALLLHCRDSFRRVT